MSAGLQTVVRFSWWARMQHAFVVLLFGVLVATGLPQRWPLADLSRFAVELMGGIFATRFVHRAAGIAFVVLLVLHLAPLVAMTLARRAPPTMLLTRRDFHDAIDSLRYAAGWSDRQPRYGRYDFRQKFEYWGMIFGSLLMAVTGVVLLAPVLVSHLLPAELIPVAKVLHGNEALLALGIVLVWHLYSAHLAPEVFPGDGSIFSGRIGLDRQLREHPLEERNDLPVEQEEVERPPRADRSGDGRETV